MRRGMPVLVSLRVPWHIDNRGGGGIGNGPHLTVNACHGHVSMK